jgi:hypothetical protein
MERMPIDIITARAALVGAATFGQQSLGKLKNREEAKASLARLFSSGDEILIEWMKRRSEWQRTLNRR